MYSRKISRKLNNFESSSPSNSANRSGKNSRRNIINNIRTDSEGDSDSQSCSDSDDYYNSEVSQGIVGEIYQNKYIILKYLGKGTFSRVWMVYDVTSDAFYAMKVVYSKYSEDAEHEIDMYKNLGNKYKNVTNVKMDMIQNRLFWKL